MFIYMYVYVRLCLSDNITESYAGAAPFVKVEGYYWTASIARNQVHRGNKVGLAAPGMQKAYADHGSEIVTTAVSTENALQMEGLLAFVIASHKTLRPGKGLNRFFFNLFFFQSFART
jgi:hypothetical protein